MRILRRVLLLLLFVGIFVGAWQFTHRNGQDVTIDLTFWQVQNAPLWAALALAFCAGVLATVGLLIVPMARTGLTARHYRREVRDLESEIHQLRNLPLAGSDGPGKHASGHRGGDPRADEVGDPITTTLRRS